MAFPARDRFVDWIRFIDLTLLLSRRLISLTLMQKFLSNIFILFFLFFLFFLVPQAYSQIRYKIADFFKSPIEYRTPFTFSLFDLKGGVTFLGARSITFDSTETELEYFDSTPIRTIYSVDLDLFKFNYFRYILRQNFIDFQTGFGVKYMSGFVRLGLPSSWPRDHPDDGTRLYFYPELLEANINQSFLYQFSRRFYGYFQINFGRALASLYHSKEGSRYLDQEGLTYSYALGVKMFRKPRSVSKEGYGLEVRYTLAKFENFRDPDNKSPIINLNFSNIGIYFTVNSILGGNPTVGDEANALYKSGDYIAAKANFETFLESYTKHSRQFKARKIIQECINHIPYQEVAIAESFIEAENFTKAANYLSSASRLESPDLRERINKNYRKISSRLFENIREYILANEINAAQDLLQYLESHKITEVQDTINQYWSEVYFHRGTTFMEYEVWDKALYYFDLAVKKNPPIRERIDPWILKIAIGYINDANKSVDKKSIDLALESLRQASRVRPDIDFITREHIEKLEQGIEYLKQEAASEKLRRSVEQIRTIPLDTPQPEPGIKSKIVLSMWGEPAYKNTLTDNLNQIYELWIYQFPDDSEKHLFFRDKVLLKIESK